jgi:hypothetical protein
MQIHRLMTDFSHFSKTRMVTQVQGGDSFFWMAQLAETQLDTFQMGAPILQCHVHCLLNLLGRMILMQLQDLDEFSDSTHPI